MLSLTAALSFGGQRTFPPRLDPAALERHIFDAVNNQRSKATLKPLRRDVRLIRIARAHSEDMARRQFFDHVNPEGEDPTARGRRAGYECHKVIDSGSYREGLAENLFEEPSFSRVQITGGHRIYSWNAPDDIVKQSVDGWMRSPGHRRNILERSYTMSGVGIGISNNDVYITQLFC